jgi:hypothetical protein
MKFVLTVSLRYAESQQAMLYLSSVFSTRLLTDYEQFDELIDT